MIFQPFLLDVNESNAYICASRRTRDAILIDAGDFDSRIDDFINENDLRLNAIFVTHDHYDHTSGLAALVEQYQIDVLSASGNAGRIPGKRVAHGQQIALGDLKATVLATPGHTFDSISLAFPELVFTGDALFAGSVGGTSSADAAQQQIQAIRRHILSLAPDCEIYPGHGPATTVNIEKQSNPFLIE